MTRFTVFTSFTVLFSKFTVFTRFTVWRSATGQSGDQLPLQGSPSSTVTKFTVWRLATDSPSSGDQIQDNQEIIYLYKVHRLEISYRTIRRSVTFTRFTVFYSYKVHRLEISYRTIDVLRLSTFTRFTVFWRSDAVTKFTVWRSATFQGSPSGDQL